MSRRVTIVIMTDNDFRLQRNEFVQYQASVDKKEALPEGHWHHVDQKLAEIRQLFPDLVGHERQERIQACVLHVIVRCIYLLIFHTTITQALEPIHHPGQERFRNI